MLFLYLCTIVFASLTFFPKCYCIWPNPHFVSQRLPNHSVTVAKIPLHCGINLKFQLPNPNSIFPPKANCMITNAYTRAYKNFRRQIKLPSTTNCSNTTVTVQILVKNPEHDRVNPVIDKTSDEAYNITINERGVISIEASTTIAALRSAWTLFQIPGAAGTINSDQYPITIRDEPAMIYRGVMMDTTRSLNPKRGERHSITRLYEMIDKMEIVKLNVLHWHLTDTDGLSFPFQNAQVPNPYHPEEIRAFIKYAMVRGVAVIPEVDVMGHTGRFWGQQTGIADFAPEDCPDQFNLDSTTAKLFIVQLYQYMITNLFGDSVIFGTGQDEVAPCGNNYREDSISLQKKLHDIAKENGNKTVMVWGDTILEQNLSFDKDTLVMPWRAYDGFTNYGDGVNALLSLGYRTIIYNQNPWYIGDSTTAKGLYNYHPLDGVTDIRGGVLGGAVSLWEPSIQDLKSQKFWPMSSAVAEILWSKREFTKSNGFNNDRYTLIKDFIKNSPAMPDKTEICSY